MALQHRETQTYGVQFHPESLLTGDGKRMLANFLNRFPVCLWNCRPLWKIVRKQN